LLIVISDQLIIRSLNDYTILKIKDGKNRVGVQSAGDQLWLCGLIPHSALVGVREYVGKVKKN
jgi:hypothetical protein